MAAGWHWFGATPADNRVADYKRQGIEVPPDVAAHLNASSTHRPFTVWFDSWPAVELFLSCVTQWRLAPMGALLGLDYTALAAAMWMRRERDRRALFDDVRLIERGAVAASRGTPLEELLHG